MDLETIGPYRVIRHLAAGGMGEVFLARNESAGIARPCVVKTIHARLGGDEAARKRFLDEARLALQLSHKNICSVTHVGEHDGDPFMAMDFVAGRDLRDVLTALHARGRRMTPPLALFVLREILDGLEYAHRAVDIDTGAPLNLVHRDLTPSNVMISVEGEVEIIDFGQALSTLKAVQTATGVVFGKLQYLSPEQARGELLDQRSDLFSLAIIAAELLVGTRYYEGVARDRLFAHAQKGYRSPLLDTIDGPIRDLLLLALEPDRDKRIVTAEQMRTRVDRLLVQRQAVVGPGDLRRLLNELFPGELERQREWLARASGSFPPAPLAALPATPPMEGDTAPEDGFGVTEAIPTVVAPAPAQNRAGAAKVTSPVAISAALGALVLLGIVVVAVIIGRSSVAALPRSSTDAGVVALAPPPPPSTSPPEADSSLTLPTPPTDTSADDVGTAVEVAPAIEPLATTDPAPRPKLARPRTTAEKLKLLERCQHRCAAGVLDKYSRFATLSVDEARGLAAELGTCVKRCGG